MKVNSSYESEWNSQSILSKQRTNRLSPSWNRFDLINTFQKEWIDISNWRIFFFIFHVFWLLLDAEKITKLRVLDFVWFTVFLLNFKNSFFWYDWIEHWSLYWTASFSTNWFCIWVTKIGKVQKILKQTFSPFYLNEAKSNFCENGLRLKRANKLKLPESIASNCFQIKKEILSWGLNFYGIL